MNEETYLSDGLYASYDGWMVKLYTQRGDDEHWVGLEPEVWERLLIFVIESNRKQESNK